MTLPMQETRFSILLDELAAKQEATIAPYLLADGTKVWVRKAGRHNARWRYALLGMVARYLKLGVLKPVPSFGGEPAIATESKRLYELRSAGIAVPELLAVRKNALMFGNLEGIPLDTQIRQEAEAGKADAWLAGLEAIARVHKKRQFLSQAFARNMMWDGKNISFLDFEDDPSEVLTIAQCQARDWLCYIHSTALILKNGGLLEAAAEKWGGVLSDQPAEIQKLIAGTVKPILPIRRLEHPRWGRDALRLAASISLISLADMPP
ncbi:TPA: hypothetical protein WLR49_000932 [Neisseria gonorrhoeae]